MVANYHGYETDLMALRRRFQMSLKGATLKQLMEIAENLGFSGRPLRGEVSDLSSVTLPAIMHWNLNHFVVLVRISNGIKGKKYHIHDPATGIQVIQEQELSNRFTGVILELTKSERFRPEQEKTRLRVNQLWSRMEGFWSSFKQVLLLSAVLQLSVIIAPFFLQISVDTVLPSFDQDLLFILAIGFGGVAIVSMLTSWVRSLVLVRLGTILSYQVNVNLFRHLLRLPLPWFERRHVGDIISRFGSTKPISELLSQGLISSLIDGIMAILTLVLMFVYSPILAVIAIAALALIACLRGTFFASLRHANVNMIGAVARENSAFIESLRGVATIKAFGEEANRQRYWQQKKAESTNTEIKTGRLNAGFVAGEQFIFAMERIVFVYFAIKFAMDGTITVGMIFALQSYRQQFLDTTSRLIQQAVSYRLLDMHLMRIADIALSVPEEAGPIPMGQNCGLSTPARIELRNVRFRYAPNEPEVLKGISLDICPGEMIAFVGASGNGKTTLIKIMMGLLLPTSGEVFVNGEKLQALGASVWRRQIASVSQDDVLFAGSIADNISFFDAEADHSRVVRSAKLANIDHEINNMPMRYNTPVGDMGSVLSGGQKQRVMLARAIYRNPCAIFLDEATAHLDQDNEVEVGEAVRSLEYTRIVIAHRPQTIERADRIFSVDNGQIAIKKN